MRATTAYYYFVITITIFDLPIWAIKYESLASLFLTSIGGYLFLNYSHVYEIITPEIKKNSNVFDNIFFLILLIRLLGMINKK